MNPSGSETNLVWWHPWMPEIATALISDRNHEGTLKNSDLELAALVLHIPFWKRALSQQWPRTTRNRITCLTFPGAHRRHRPSTRWLRTSSTSAWSTHDSFFLTFRSSTTQAWKIAWRMIHLASLTYLTPRLLPTFPSPTHSHTFRGNSTPWSCNCFLAWYSRCAGSLARRYYTGCAPTETLPAVGQFLLHTVGQPYSSRFISPSSWNPAGIWTQGPTHPVLQALSGPTWEIVGFLGMGENCGDPPPGWPPWPKIASQRPCPHQTGETSRPTA